MNKIYTEYGMLKGITSVNFYFTGELEACTLGERSKLIVNGCELNPLYGFSDRRRKEGPAVTFYEEGTMKSIALNEATKIDTSLGEVEVEKITFYPDGSIKRLFLLDGKLSAYWGEDDEYNLAKKYSLSFDFTEFTAKIISMQFYQSGKIKSLTLWPKENISVKTNFGDIQVRTGIAFYESGKLKSCEPRKRTKIKTIIGEIEAYDVNAIGIHGEANSLCFYETGGIKSLITISNSIKVIDKDGVVNTFQPTTELKNIMAVEKYVKPLSVEFQNDYVVIDKENKYKISENTFVIDDVNKKNLIFQCSCDQGIISTV